MSDKANEPTTRWTAEFFGLGSLLNRWAGSIYGLVFFEVAWFWIVSSLAGLANVTPAGKALSLPWPVTRTVLIHDLLAYGAVVTFALWIYLSGYWRYLWCGARAITGTLLAGIL